MEKRRHFWLAMLIAHVSLVGLMVGIYGKPDLLWSTVVLVILAAANLWRFRQRVPIIFWIISLAMVVFTIGINDWWTAAVGDEYIFHQQAWVMSDIMSYQDVGRLIFSAESASGQHTYFSSFIQVLFMKFLGSESFGWRFSNIYLCTLSVGLFYLFCKSFISKRVSLIAAFLFAVSSYIMAFSKIGYNNLAIAFLSDSCFGPSRVGAAVRNEAGFCVPWERTGFVFLCVSGRFVCNPAAGDPFGCLSFPPKKRSSWELGSDVPGQPGIDISIDNAADLLGIQSGWNIVQSTRSLADDFISGKALFREFVLFILFIPVFVRGIAFYCRILCGSTYRGIHPYWSVCTDISGTAAAFPIVHSLQFHLLRDYHRDVTRPAISAAHPHVPFAAGIYVDRCLGNHLGGRVHKAAIHCEQASLS